MALIRSLLLLLVFCSPVDAALRFRKILLRGNPPPPAPYSPSDIPNLFGWWKADALTNLVNGSPIVYWPDSSGHNLNMTLGDGNTAHTPYWTNNYQNGLPAAYFDGVDDFMTNVCTMTQTNLIFIVVKHQIPESATFGFLVTAQLATGGNIHQKFYWGNVGGDIYEPIMYAGGSVSGVGPNTNTTATYAMEFSDASGILFTNGVVLNTGTGVGAGNMVGGMAVGYDGPAAGFYYFKGHLMEMFCVTNAFATQGTLLQDATLYFKNKYAHH